MKLLIVDSDQDLVEMLTSLLKTYGYEVYRAYDGERARMAWEQHEPDLVILDSALRDTDAFALCRDMQGKHDALVLMLAEQADVHTEVSSLESGADDFLRKPFLPGQLMAHIHAMSRRVRKTLKARPHSLVTVGPISVDLHRNAASVNGATVHLTPTEAKLLHLLTINANEVCTAEQIVTHVWGYGDYGDATLIKAHIRHLRMKLEPEPSNPRYILTVPSVGYMLARHAAEPEPAPATHRAAHVSVARPQPVHARPRLSPLPRLATASHSSGI